MSQHTPTPWRRDDYGTVLDPNGRTVAINGVAAVMSPGKWQDEAKANATFIVKAVNLHDELVAVARLALEAANLLEKLTGCRGDDDYVWGMQANIKAVLVKADAQAALDKAEAS